MLRKNVLIVGGGSIGKKHRLIAEECNCIDQITVVGQREFDKEVKNSSIAERKAYIENLVGRNPDFAIVAGPATRHIDTASVLLNMGVHTIIEKPLSTDGEDAKKFMEFSDETNLCVSVGYNLRFSHALDLFKQTIDNGELGRIYSVRCEVGQYLPDWRPDADYRQSVSANASMGGGVLLELSHEIDYLQWIFGPVKRVSGSIYSCSELEIDVEDTAHFLLSFAASQSSRQVTASVSMDFIRQDPTRRCIAIGEFGTLKWDGVADELSIYKSGQTQWKTLYKCNSTKAHSYKRALLNFIDCMDSNRSPMVTVKDGVCVLNVIDAIRKSSDMNCLVNVAY